MTDTIELTHLEKAKGALAHAGDIANQLGEALDDEGNKDAKRDYLRLLDVASIQASVAQAEALASIGNALERIAEHLAYPPITVSFSEAGQSAADAMRAALYTAVNADAPEPQEPATVGDRSMVP